MQTQNPTRFADALAQYGLNWNVEKRPIFTLGNDGQPLTVEDSMALVRTDKGLPLSVVGNRYVPVQNNACGDIIDAVLEKTGGEYVKGGMFAHGRKLYVQAKLPDTIRVKGRDESQKLLTFITSHDMTTQVLLGFWAYRISCLNSFMAAVRGLTSQIVLRHTKSVDAKLETVQAILESQLVYFRELEVKANWLADQRFTDIQFELAMRKVLDVKPEEKESDIHKRTRDIMDTLRTNFVSGKGIDESNRGTAWAAYNAFTEYTNHQKPTRGLGDDKDAQQSRRFESLLFGQGGAMNADALSVIESQLAA